MTFKELLEHTKGIFKWDVVPETVFNKKKQTTMTDYPVLGAFYKEKYYVGYWYNRVFYFFEGLDGTDEEIWPDRDWQTEYKSVKKLMKAIPDFECMIKEGEIIVKKLKIDKDFDDKIL